MDYCRFRVLLNCYTCNKQIDLQMFVSEVKFILVCIVKKVCIQKKVSILVFFLIY